MDELGLRIRIDLMQIRIQHFLKLRIRIGSSSGSRVFNLMTSLHIYDYCQYYDM
jgi:hypothetical protein